MLALAAFATAAYAFVNAFGAWMVSRRQPAVAGLFMLAAAVLMVAAAALIAEMPFFRAILASGLVLASVASLLNAHLVIGTVRWPHHLLRATAALVLYLVAHWAASV